MARAIGIRTGRLGAFPFVGRLDSSKTFFGAGVLADPSIVGSYPGLVSSTSGNIYPQTGAATIVKTTGGATDPVYENRGATADLYGGGLWVFPSTANLALDAFDFSLGGWSTTDAMTVTSSSVTAPDGTIVQKLYQTTVNYADKYVSVTSTNDAVYYSVWYRWDATNPPTVTFPGFTRGVYTLQGVRGLFANQTSLTRFSSGTPAGGINTSTVGITPAGSNSSAIAVLDGAGAIEAWGFMVILGSDDLPIINGTASAAKTLDAAHSALIIDRNGNLDFEITVMPQEVQATEKIGYLWSATGADGLCALRNDTGGHILIFTVRGVDVLNTTPTCANAWTHGEPITIRCWYNISSGQAGMRRCAAGTYLRETTASTTGGPLAPLGTMYLGTNLGSSTGAFLGRIKPYRRPTPSLLSPTIPNVEGIIAGDSIVAPFLLGSNSLDSVGSYLYTAGALGEWTSRPGLGCLAKSGYLINSNRTDWINAGVIQWRGLSSIKWFWIQVAINDVIVDHSAATIKTDLQALITQFKTDAPTAKIILNTMLPFGNYVDWTSGRNAIWASVNTAITDGTITGADVVIDVANVASPFNDGTGKLAAAYDVGDGLHTNNAGRMAQAQHATYGLRHALQGLGLLP